VIFSITYLTFIVSAAAPHMICCGPPDVADIAGLFTREIVRLAIRTQIQAATLAFSRDL